MILLVLKICNAMTMENALAKLVLVKPMKMEKLSVESVIPAFQLILDHFQIVKVSDSFYRKCVRFRFHFVFLLSAIAALACYLNFWAKIEYFT